MSDILAMGKLSAAQLQRLVLDKFTFLRDEVVCAASMGVDCAALKLAEGGLCVLSSDPITAATRNIGEIAVHICCNDAAAAGAEPIGILTTLLLPVGCSERQVDEITTDIARTAQQIGVSVLGGHTEVTDAVNRIVISATVVASAPGGTLVDSAGMQIGDDILLTKWAGLEGTAILANDFPTVCKRILTAEQYEHALEAKRYLSVVPEGRICAKLGAHALHDVTEGGVLGAVWEMAHASGCGASIQSDKIAVRTETELLCRHFQINPYQLISSGCMLVACANAEQTLQALQAQGIFATIIGKATLQGILCDEQSIAPPQADELYKALRKAQDETNHHVEPV